VAKQSCAGADSTASSPVSAPPGPVTRIRACNDPAPSRAIDNAAAFDASPASTRRRKWIRYPERQFVSRSARQPPPGPPGAARRRPPPGPAQTCSAARPQTAGKPPPLLRRSPSDSCHHRRTPRTPVSFARRPIARRRAAPGCAADFCQHGGHPPSATPRGELGAARPPPMWEIMPRRQQQHEHRDQPTSGRAAACQRPRPEARANDGQCDTNRD
jgi:hypothetical protein